MIIPKVLLFLNSLGMIVDPFNVVPINHGTIINAGFVRKYVFKNEAFKNSQTVGCINHNVLELSA